MCGTWKKRRLYFLKFKVRLASLKLKVELNDFYEFVIVLYDIIDVLRLILGVSEVGEGLSWKSASWRLDIR